MEIHNNLQQTVYNICQLILRKKYKRAIYIADSIETQGFSTHELITLKSYAISKLHGPDKALESLQHVEGPLVSMAKAQYAQFIHNWQEAHAHLSHLSVQQKEAPIDSLLRSNQALQSKLIQEPLPSHSQTVTFVADHKEQQCIRNINAVTEEYVAIKQKWDSQQICQEEYHLNCQQLANKYQGIIKQHRPEKKILSCLQQYIKYLRELKQS